MTTKIKILIFVAFTLSYNYSFSQLNDKLNDTINNIFYRSLAWDGLLYYYTDTDLLKFCKENEKSSSEIDGKFYFKYKVCNYKVSIKSLKFANGEEYKILYFKTSGELNVCFRLYGFVENDFIHLYERILSQYLPKRKILKHIKQWQEADTLFNSIDFQGLIYSVEHSDNKVPAMISHTLKSHLASVPNILSVNKEYYYKTFYLVNNIYAYFSNRPIDGSLTYNIPYKERKRVFRKNKNCDCF